MDGDVGHAKPEISDQKLKSQGNPSSMIGMLLPRQSKAARALLEWNQEKLASESGVRLGTIKDFERGKHQLNARALSILAKTYQKAGLVLFFEDDNGGVGVREKRASEE